MALKKSQKSLKDWTSQEWGTKSGKKSAETGERYLPKSAIASLSPQEYAASTKKKREDTKKGKQHSKQPKKIAKKTASHRYSGGLMAKGMSDIDKLGQTGKGMSDKAKRLLLEDPNDPMMGETFSEMYSRLEKDTGGAPMMPAYAYEHWSYDEFKDKESSKEKNEGGLMSDTSPRMERAREAREEREELGLPEDTTVQDAAYFAASLAPVTGEAIAAKEAAESFEQGDYGGAAFLAAGAIPGLGFIPRAAGKALRKAKAKLGKIPEGGLDASDFSDDELADLLKSISDKDKKRKAKIEADLEKNRMSKEEIDAFISRQPTSTEISDAMDRNELPMGTAYDVKKQTSVWAEHWKKADPLDIGFDEDLFTAPASASKTDDYFYKGLSRVKDNFANATFGKGNMDDVFRNKPVEKGTKTSLRLNLNSKIPNVDKGLSKATTVHFDKPSGPVASYVATGTVDDAVFEVNQKGRALISSKVDNKFPAMGVTGKWNPDETVFNAASKRDLVGRYAGEKGHPTDVIEIKFNPFSDHLFKDARTGWAVKSAEKATTIGDRVFAIGVKYHSKADAPKALEKVSKTKKGEKIEGTAPPSTVRFPFNKGGLMKEPEELYHGGMMSDCGPMSTTEIVVGFDPESGNEVPLGSSAKNVRDDLDAVLSDGEYVLPADVVKWHGLKHIQGMHVEAEMGLMSMAMDDLVPTDYDMDKDEVKDMKDNGGYVLDQKAKPLEAEKVTQEPNTKKGKKIKTPDGESITVAAVDTTDTPTKVKKEDDKYASKVKGNLKAFYGGGLMEKKGFAEGGNPFALEDNAIMMQQYEDSDEQERLRELEERYAREEDLTASEVDELDSLRNPDREDSSQDVADSVVEDADAEVDVDFDTDLSDTPAQDAEKFKDLEPNDVAKALMKAAQSYGGSEDEYSAFQTGIAGGMQMFDVGQKVGDKLSNFSFEKGGETVTPFAFLRDDEGFFRRRK